MTRKETEQRYQQISMLVQSQQLTSALEELGKLARFATGTDPYYQLESLTENYRTLLRYAWEGYKDPEQRRILDNLCASILTIADGIRESLLEPGLPFTRAERKSVNTDAGDDPATQAARIEELLFHREVGKLIDTTGEQSIRQTDQMFRIIWLTSQLTESHAGLLRQINRSEQIPWHEKCLIVSALTISLLQRFDPAKIRLLVEFSAAGENQVYQRALIGLILGLLRYDDRLVFHPDIIEEVKELTTDETVIPAVEFILLQLLQARETEKITREFEEEILPEMKKMIPRIEDKLQMQDPSDEADMEEKNPGWKEMMDEVPGLFEKVEKFSRMQMEGGDVFMSTFRMLKRFDFFNLMSNWFAPFHRDHPEIAHIFPEEEEINERLLESLEKAFYICNSDKYSFAINFRSIPDQQRTMIVTNFEAEFAQMKDMASEEQLLDQSLAKNAIFIQYIQDLYRFFKLFPARAEFDDVFSRRIRLNELWFYPACFRREGFPEKVASFYFDNDHFNEAIDAYEGLLVQGTPNGEYFEKIGYCYQKTGLFKKAIEYYRKAELFDTNRLWILKKLGWCCLKLKEYRQALQYFQDAASIQPDDVQLKMQAGQCLLNLREFEEALHHYSGLRYFLPDDLKVLRPLAWCQFVTRKPEAAGETYHRILEVAAPPSAYDLMNAAHVRLCLGEREQALELYRSAFQQDSPGPAALAEAFAGDAQHLTDNGIAPAEIPLIRDYLLFRSGIGLLP